jgi:hypothetical protein
MSRTRKVFYIIVDVLGILLGLFFTWLPAIDSERFPSWNVAFILIGMFGIFHMLRRLIIDVSNWNRTSEVYRGGYRS